MDGDAGRGESGWPAGGGTMGALIRAHDWSRTPLGPIGTWPQSLKAAVSVMLGNRHPMFIFWGAGAVCLYNDGCADSLGSEKHPSILGARGSEAWPETWHIIGPQFERVMAGGEPTWHEGRLVPIIRRGRREDVCWTYSFGPIPDADAPNGVAGALVICTETTQALASRRGSEERYRILFDSIDQGFCTVDVVFDEQGRPVDYVFVEVNRAFEAQTGLRDAAGKSMRALRPKHEEHWFQIYGRIARTGRPERFEHQAAELGRWYAVYAFREDPEHHRVAILFDDITAHKQAEEALRTSEERYRGLVETQADMIVRIGADGRFTFVNDTGCRTLGCSRDDFLNLHWSQFVHPDDAGAIEAAIEETRISPDHRTTVEARLLTADGIRWYSWEGYAILDEAGRFIEKQSVGRDITERKAMEDALLRAKDAADRAREEAEQATLAKSKFLAAASHDLRQPMQSLLLFLNVLRPSVAPKGQEALLHLGRGLDALRDLLDRLFDISQLDAGEVTPTVEEFPVARVIEQIGAAYKPVAAAKELTLQVDACRAVVRSDRTLLGRMVRNLVENALRYTERGRITVACREVGGTLRIEVADTGIGIPPEHLERIWEEFHQVGNPERDRNRGLGLGLAIVHRLSSRLEHPVEVRSALGRGSVFSIDVPLSRGEPRQTPRMAEATTEVAGNGRFAVLVDDDAIVLLGLKATFEAWGYEVLAAGSTDRALASLKVNGRRPDIVVADYRLREGRNGTEAILRVREAYGADIPGIILTGETGEEVQRDAAEHALGIIHKPATPRQLSMALENHMKAAGASR